MKAWKVEPVLIWIQSTQRRVRPVVLVACAIYSATVNGQSMRCRNFWLVKTRTRYTNPGEFVFQDARLSKGICDLFQIDLVLLSSLSSFNDGMRYLLTCIDIFSKRAWAVPVARKSAQDVVEAFEKILADQKCTMVQSDKGTELLNSTFQSMLKWHGIKFYTSENEDLKAGVVEQFNRTLKRKIFRYFIGKICVVT